MISAVRQVSEGKQNKHNHIGNFVWFVSDMPKGKNNKSDTCLGNLTLGFVADWVSRGDETY